MIEAQVSESQEVQANSTPEVITISGIITDLENGIDRDGIAKKYGLDKSEVKTMFLHPALKGKRVKKNRVKELRFTLVDDVTPQIDLNQIDLEDCIDCPEIAETTAEATLPIQAIVEDHYSSTDLEVETFNTATDDGDSK
tara:strand:- start:4927 stop:5346 length:420 start_codon:yes stop_codon:yes gene_type:complete